jgi:UDP-sugar pyrophosphorylase
MMGPRVLTGTLRPRSNAGRRCGRYADESRQTFKKPTRLECMMQDLPRLFKGDEKVGFTTLTGSGMSSERVAALVSAGVFKRDSAATLLETDINFYSPCKNNKVDACAKQRKGVHPSSASSGEADLYTANCRLLVALGVIVHPPRRLTFGQAPEDIWIDDWPHIVISPGYCLTSAHLRQVFPSPEKVKISSGATLVLEGTGKIVIESLKLDGALTIRCPDRDASITVRNSVVANRFVRIFLSSFLR